MWTTPDSVDTVIAYYQQNLTSRGYVQKSATTIPPDDTTPGPGRSNGGNEMKFQKSKTVLVIKVVTLEQVSKTRITVDLG